MTRTPLNLPQIEPRDRAQTINEAPANEVAAQHGFTSREEKPKRKRQRASFGFTDTFSLRCTAADKARFNQIADENGWPAGKLFAELVKLYGGSGSDSQSEAD